MTSFCVEFCLVMIAWGSKYSDRQIQYIHENARKSVGYRSTILITDKLRSNLSDEIEQKHIPEFYDKQEFFKGGLRAKIAIFDRTILPKETVCLYVDLDSLILGDLQSVVKLLKSKNEILMLPPHGLEKISFVARLLARITSGKFFPVGNSSIMLFNSSESLNISESFKVLYHNKKREEHFSIDDGIISWCSKRNLNWFPKTTCTMFRRKYMSRSVVVLYLTLLIDLFFRTKTEPAILTFNDDFCKPDALVKLRPGKKAVDMKGRKLIWSKRFLGPPHDAIHAWDRYLNAKDINTVTKISTFNLDKTNGCT